MFVGHFATAHAAKRLVPRAGVIGGLLLVALAAWVDRHREPA